MYFAKFEIKTLLLLYYYYLLFLLFVGCPEPHLTLARYDSI